MIALLLAFATPTSLPLYPFCQPGYATQQRVLHNRYYYSAIKRKLLHGRPFKRYILDHIVPIEVGGSAADPANMQLQTKAKAHAKDLVEHRLHREVCSGRLSPAAAQEQMRVWRRPAPAP